MAGEEEKTAVEEPEVEEEREEEEGFADPDDAPDEDAFDPEEISGESKKETDSAAETKSGGKEKDDSSASADEPSFDNDLLRRAEAIGVSEAEAREYGSPLLLEKAVLLAERQADAAVRRVQASAATQPAQQPQGEQKKAEGEEQENSHKYKLNLDPDLFDPEVVKELNGMNDHYSKVVETLQGQLQQVLAAEQGRQREAFVQRMDGLFDGLGEEFHAEFGKGPSDKLDGRTKETQNRDRVLLRMTSLMGEYSRTGKAIPSQKQLFTEAVHSLYGDKAKTLARREINSALGKRKSQATHRPTQRKQRGSVGGDGEDRAVSFAEGFYKEKGVGNDEDDDLF